jgi:hypothetical protein
MAEAGYRTGVLDLTAGRWERERPSSASRIDIAGSRCCSDGAQHFPDARLQNDISARMTRR